MLWLWGSTVSILIIGRVSWKQLCVRVRKKRDSVQHGLHSRCRHDQRSVQYSLAFQHAPATLLTTASLTTFLPMTMRVLILLYSTTLTIAHIRIVQTALVQQLKTSRLLVTAVSWGVPPA